jgi:hypothetical protein
MALAIAGTLVFQGEDSRARGDNGPQRRAAQRRLLHCGGVVLATGLGLLIRNLLRRVANGSGHYM